MNQIKTKKYAQKLLLPIAIFAIGIAIDFGLTEFVKNKNKVEASIAFELESKKIVSIIKRNIETNQYGLRGARGVFVTDQSLTLSKFKAYSQSRNLAKEFPGALGFGFIQRIKDNEKLKLEKEMQAYGIEDFKIHNISPNEIPSKNYIIKYIEPISNNYNLLGLNIASARNRFIAADNAMYTGEATMSSPIEMTFKNKQQIGSYYFLPVYKNGEPTTNPIEREKALIGWTFAPIVYENDIDTILKDYVDLIDIEIFTNDGELIYDADNLYNNILKNKTTIPNKVEGPSYNEREFDYLGTINVGDFKWKYHTSSLKYFKPSIPQLSPYIVFITGLFIDFIISGILLSISLIRFRALDIADEMTIKYKEKKEEAEKATLDKSEFLATIGHEIRAPLSGIIGLSQFLLDSELKNDQRLLAANIKDSSNLLFHLLNDILDYSKLEAKKLRIENTEFSLEKVFNQVITLFQTEAQKKNLEIIFTIDQKIESTLIGDEFRIRQILTNLISNSIKFTLKGQIELKAIVIKTEDQAQTIQIIVKDSGIGITKEAQTKLFNRYTQADDSIARKYGGTGLGLSITKALVELMMGEIILKSELGIGTEFFITIPFKYSKTKTEVTRKIENNLKILVIDDNDINVLLASKTLEKLQLNPLVARNAKEAIELVEKNEFHLIFLDLELPDMSGIELAKIIREKEKTKSIIVALSAHTADDKKEKCIENGMDDFISKPFSKLKAIDLLKKWFNI